TAAYAIKRVVRVVMGETIGVAYFTAAQGEGNAVPRATEIILTDVGSEDDATGIRITDVSADRPGRLLFHLVRHVDHVIHAGDALRIRFHDTEETEALQATFRQVDQRRICWRRLELAHLASQHLVGCLMIAGVGDTTHVNFLARV